MVFDPMKGSDRRQRLGRWRARLPALLIVGFLAASAQSADRAGDRGGSGERGSETNLKHPLYEFAGALNDTSSTVKKATVVMCANTHPTDPVEIEVVLYNYNAVDSYHGLITVDPMKTATFESSQVDFYLADVFIDAGSVQQGLGQIRTSHRSVICTAQTIDPGGPTPSWSFDLPVYRVPLPEDDVFSDRFEAP